MSDRPVIIGEDVPADRPGQRSRRKLLAGALACLVVAGGIIALSGDDSDPTVQVNAAQPGEPTGDALNGAIFPPGVPETVPPPEQVLPSPTPTTAPPEVAPTTTTTKPLASTTSTAPARRTPVMTADDGSWTLTRVDTGSKRCLELTVGANTTGSLLCNAPSPQGLFGRYAIAETPIGPIVVAMVDARPTDMKGMFGDGVIPKFGADPTEQDLHYAVGVVKNLGGGSPSKGLDLFLMEGENTLARANVSLAPGQYEAATLVTTAPYGSWAGYRKAGYAGYFWGGNEDVGFYDDPSGDGSRCLLWRRFGGMREGVIADICPPPTDTVFAFAELRDEPGSNGYGVRPTVVVDAPAITRWTCTWDTNNPCAFTGQILKDPAGSARSLLAYFPGAFKKDGNRMTITAWDGQRSLGEITVDVQPA